MSTFRLSSSLVLLSVAASSAASAAPAAAAAATLPVLPLEAASAPWAAAGSAACSGGFCGDIRARLEVQAGDVVGGLATAQVFWRRRDPTPENKAVIVTDAAGAAVAVASATVESTCGVVSFAAPAGGGTFFAYYLPFQQGNGGAWTTFSWIGCNDTAYDESNPCVLGRRRLGAASVCEAATPAAALAVALENRDSFNAFTVMELMAAPAELAAAAAALAQRAGGAPWVGVFPEDRSRAVRVFDGGIPARWLPGGAPGGPDPYSPAGPAFAGTAAPGEWYAFQVGLWAFANGVANLTASATALAGPGAAAIPASAFAFVNLQGVDIGGVPFSKTDFGVDAGEVAALWVGVQVPPDAAAGAYAGAVLLSTLGGLPPLAVNITITVAGAPVDFGGAGNVTSFARLSWLYSTRGLEDTVPAPFTPVEAQGGGGSGLPLVVGVPLKRVAVGEDGMIADVIVTLPRRGGAAANALLAGAVRFELFGTGGGAQPLPSAIASAAAVSALSNSSVSWAARSVVSAPGGGSLTVDVDGSIDFTSYANFVVTISNAAGAAAPVALGDVRLTVPVAPQICGYVVGMDNGGANAAPYADKQWRWTNSTGANKLWLGRAEGGVLLNLKGDGIKWDSPMFGEDYPIVPYVPSTWGGSDAQPVTNAFGVNVTNCSATAFSGPRSLGPGESVTFRFDLALTPSKVANYTRHFATRAFQVGYGTTYQSPQEMSEQGVRVITLHQGTPGIVNGSLINPWINYPFLDDTVPLLENYTEQANALGLLVRYYYTVRELSSRAVEIFAFLAQQGEILVSQDPYIIVQPGYAHEWNTHGGSAWLHQHAGSSYAACWQQTESNGEWDPSMCSIGVSRLFNYYVEGLFYGMNQSPHMNGNYYDGTNFPRQAMLRIRRAANAGAAARGLGLPALLDLHTGREGTPDACSYASHYPLVDSVWNGEGFDFSGSPAYWLVEVSSKVHGLTGDMLGAGVDAAFKGALFGMTTRNSGEAPAWWAFWDAARIAEAAEDAVFSTLDLLPSPVRIAATSCGGGNPGTCNFSVTKNSYYDGAPCGNPAGNEACFGDGTPIGRLALADAQARCCADALCGGISFEPSVGSGCFKRSNSCLVGASGVDGYQKPGFEPAPAPGEDATHATVFSKFGSHAIVAVATWCPGGNVTATLALDYAALGLDASRLSVTAPAIAGVQKAASFAAAEGPFTLAGGGIVLLLEAQ